MSVYVDSALPTPVVPVTTGTVTQVTEAVQAHVDHLELLANQAGVARGHGDWRSMEDLQAALEAQKRNVSFLITQLVHARWV